MIVPFGSFTEIESDVAEMGWTCCASVSRSSVCVDPVSKQICPKKDKLFLRIAVLHTGKFKESNFLSWEISQFLLNRILEPPVGSSCVVAARAALL